jgi:hypothetical protein
MTSTASTRQSLADLGDALRAATAADLARGARRRRRRTVAGVLAAAAVVLPGGALAADALISGDDVARSIPQGTWALMGTHPRCTVVRVNVEFDCVLEAAPRAGDVAPGGWKGTVEPTVDDTRHVNGGCRSLEAGGRHWRCYLGEEAVRQRIIDAGFLGHTAQAPGRG